MILVPIFVEGSWWGFIGFDDCVKEREWSAAEIDALTAAASTLGAALQRQAVEEELGASETRYRAVIEQATDGIYLLDAGTRRIIETNPSFGRMLGYAPEELIGMEVYDFVAHPRENVDATIGRTLELRRRVVGGRKYRRRDGTLVDVEVGVNVISLEGRDVICTIVRDVTERMQAEEDLKQSEELYRTVMEQATENICLVDVETRRIVESNPAFREALGYTEDELHDMTLYDFVAHDRKSIDLNIQRTVQARSSFVGQRKYRRKDGSLLDVEAAAASSCAAAGRPCASSPTTSQTGRGYNASSRSAWPPSRTSPPTWPSSSHRGHPERPGKERRERQHGRRLRGGPHRRERRVAPRVRLLRPARGVHGRVAGRLPGRGSIPEPQGLPHA